MSQGSNPSRDHAPRHTNIPDDDATRILSARDLSDGPDVTDPDATVPISSITNASEADDDATEFLNLSEVRSAGAQNSTDPDATRVIPAARTLPNPHEAAAVEQEDFDDSPTEAISASQDPRAHYRQRTENAYPQTRMQPAAEDATVAMPGLGAPRAHDAPQTQQFSAHAAPRSGGYSTRPVQQAQPVPAQPGQMVPGQPAPEAYISQDPPSTKVVAQHVFVIILFGALLYGTFQFFIYSVMGQRLDEQAFNEYSSQFSEYQRPTLAALDNLPTVTGVVAVIGIIIALIWKHRILPAVVGVLAGAGICLSAYILKNYLVVKPNYGIQEALMNSALSGHTAFAAAAGAALFIAAPRALRPTIAVLAALATCATGASTIINGWHRPADVISSILVAAIWTVMGLGVLRYLRHAEFNVPNPRTVGAIAVALLTIASLFLVFCAAIMYAITMFSPMPGGAFVASTCLILAVSLGSTGLVVRLLRPRNQVASPYSRVWEY